MARTSRVTRGANNGSTNKAKRIMKLGNNRWGSKGCVKCDECRRRKTKCVYNINDPHEACRDCKKRNATCGKTLPVQPGRMSGSDYSSSPTPSDTSSFHTRMSPARSVDTPRPAIVNAKASVLLGYASDYALQLERDFPSSPPRKIISCIREYVERGDFGDLRFLLSLPSSHSTNPPSQQRRPSVSTAFAPFETTTYPQSDPFPSRPHSGTINPATLTMPLVLPIPYSYTDDLHRADDIDSDSTTPPELEQPAHYNYMSISSVGLGHENRDFMAIHPRYIHGEPYASYGP